MPPGRGSSVAATPIQPTALTGSVKNSNTVYGLAATRTSRSAISSCLIPASTLLPFLGLGFALELVQMECPEALEELFQFLEALRPCAVKALGPFTSLS